MNKKDLILARVDIETMKVHKIKIDLEEIRNFREKALGDDKSKFYPGLFNIVNDKWDEFSCHVISVKNRRILGSARVTPSMSDSLPFVSSSGMDSFINQKDSEMGKFIVHPSSRSGSVFLGLLVGCAEIYSHFGYSLEIGSSIYSDVLIDGPRRLNLKTYQQLGFRDTGYRYFDENYGFESAIYVISPTRRDLMFDKIHDIYVRYSH